ncbi:MAG TPA: ABC transporter permease [Bacillota bacterium]|jgi:hypothetical protein|nr:ABC transporter permease [Bacillota bacterium]HPZ44337.1 ABC transporter permease [Bacillota bacterium]HQD77118.1 ABC transporter permease [Bacillota bacterium]HUM59578.1 ABC transporter permease [Bacillota bacterium]
MPFAIKVVAALAVSGVAFGCGLMTFLFSVASGMENRVEQTFSNLSGRIMVTQKGSVFGGLFQGVGSSSIPDYYIALIDDIPHVTNVTGQVTAVLRPVGSVLVMPLFRYGGEEAGATPFEGIERCREDGAGGQPRPAGGGRLRQGPEAGGREAGVKEYLTFYDIILPISCKIQG